MRPALATGLLALAFAVAAALFDAEPLWVPAVALALLVAGCGAWVALGCRGVRLQRTLGARRVAEDEPVKILVELHAGRFALPPARMLDPLLPGALPLRVGRGGGTPGSRPGALPLRVGRGGGTPGSRPDALPLRRGGARVRIEARFARRGRRVLALPHVVVADPLGLFTREIGAPATASADEILVLPRIEPVTRAAGGGDAARVARRGRPTVGAEVELDGIRPLRDGTPASRIFWPAIARGADPQERFLAAGSESHPLVVLDPRGAASEDDLDAAVRAAASLAHALARTGGCSVLLPGDRRPTELGDTLSGWPHLHARLALVGPSGAPSLACVTQRRGPVLFVSARMRSRLPQALGPVHGASRVLVVPGTLPSAPAVFAVAGCRGYALGGGRARAAPRRSA